MMPGEDADFVVCMREVNAPDYFDDNERGVCCRCREAIVFRPYMPSKPPKICVECMLVQLEIGQ